MSCSQGVSVTSVSFCSTEDSPLVAIGTSGCEVQLWDLESFQCVNVFKHHQGRVGSLAWNRASFLSSGSMDAAIVNYDIRMPVSFVSKYKCHT